MTPGIVGDHSQVVSPFSSRPMIVSSFMAPGRNSGRAETHADDADRR